MPRQVTLTPTDRPGFSTLTCGHTTYPVELRPDTDVALGDLLRAIGTRLWQALFPATAPAADRDTLAHALLHETTPLCLALPATLAELLWDVLCDPAQRGVGKSTLVAQAVMPYGGRYQAVRTLSCVGYQGVDLFQP